MIVPRMPIESIVFNENIRSKLSLELLQRIEENISWEDFQPDDYSGARKIILKLKEPIVLDSGCEIKALAIKGVVYRTAKSITPPLDEIYTDFLVMGISRKNVTRMKKKQHLKGGMSLACAKREYMILDKLISQGRIPSVYAR